MTEPTIPSWSSMKKHYAQTGSAIFPTPDSFRKGGEWGAKPTEDLQYGAEGNYHRERNKTAERGAEFDTRDTYQTTVDPKLTGQEAVGERNIGSKVTMKVPETGQEATSQEGYFVEGKLPTYPEDLTRQSREGRAAEAEYKGKVQDEEEKIQAAHNLNNALLHRNTGIWNDQEQMMKDLAEMISEQRQDHARDYMIGQMDRANQQKDMDLMERVNGGPDYSGTAFLRGVAGDMDKGNNQQATNALLYALLKVLGHPAYQDDSDGEWDDAPDDGPMPSYSSGDYESDWDDDEDRPVR